MTETFSNKDKDKKSVVLIDYPRKGVWAVGFATKENKGEISKNSLPLVRVQTQSVLQDVLSIDEIGKKWSTRRSLERLSKEKAGIFVLINHRDAKSYWLNMLLDKPVEVKRNRRVIGVGSQILRALGLNKIKFLGTPTKYSGLSGFDIQIEEFIDE